MRLAACIFGRAQWRHGRSLDETKYSIMSIKIRGREGGGTWHLFVCDCNIISLSWQFQARFNGTLKRAWGILAGMRLSWLWIYAIKGSNRVIFPFMQNINIYTYFVTLRWRCNLLIWLSSVLKVVDFGPGLQGDFKKQQDLKPFFYRCSYNIDL